MSQNKDRSIDYSLYIEQFIQESFYPKNFLYFFFISFPVLWEEKKNVF